MKCDKCGHENNGGKFCEECGALLQKPSPPSAPDKQKTPAVSDELHDIYDITPAADNKPDRHSAASQDSADGDSNIDIQQDISVGIISSDDGPTAVFINSQSSVETNDPMSIEQQKKELFNTLLNTIQDPESPQFTPETEENNDETHDIPDDNTESSAALPDSLKKFEEGSITHPNDKPKKKKKFYCPENPMLWSFLWLLAFAGVLSALSIFFFNVDLDGAQIAFGVIFCVLTAFVLVIDILYYLPGALVLDKMLKGKGTRLEYKLKKFELVDLAEAAKKRNRMFYLAISLFGLAFSIYHIYNLATAMVRTQLTWIALFFSIGVFVLFAVLFFVMPKFNYERMMLNGERVIIGNKSVYYGGTYYHWNRTIPEATFGTLNTKKHKFEIVFTQKTLKGETKRRKVEVYAPDTAIRGISELIKEYEASSKKYREKQEKREKKAAQEQARKQAQQAQKQLRKEQKVKEAAEKAEQAKTSTSEPKQEPTTQPTENISEQTEPIAKTKNKNI